MFLLMSKNGVLYEKPTRITWTYVSWRVSIFLYYWRSQKKNYKIIVFFSKKYTICFLFLLWDLLRSTFIEDSSFFLYLYLYKYEKLTTSLYNFVNSAIDYVTNEKALGFCIYAISRKIHWYVFFIFWIFSYRIKIVIHDVKPLFSFYINCYVNLIKLGNW